MPSGRIKEPPTDFSTALNDYLSELSSNPTENPSAAPTAIPTIASTGSPTTSPTDYPTLFPTVTPPPSGYPTLPACDAFEDCRKDGFPAPSKQPTIPPVPTSEEKAPTALSAPADLPTCEDFEDCRKEDFVTNETLSESTEPTIFPTATVDDTSILDELGPRLDFSSLSPTPVTDSGTICIRPVVVPTIVSIALVVLILL